MKKDSTALSKRVSDLFDSTVLPAETSMLVEMVIDGLESGSIKVVDRAPDGKWHVNSWVKKAILLYRRLHQEKPEDRIPGAHIATKVIIAPGSVVHIGAALDEGCMIDPLVEIGACARLGKQVFVGSGTVITDSLAPPEQPPTVLEDNVHVGENCTIGANWVIESRCVIGPGTAILPGIPVIDSITGELHNRQIPANSVVVQGGRLAKGSKQDYFLQAPIIIARRDPEHSPSQALQKALNDFLSQ